MLKYTLGYCALSILVFSVCIPSSGIAGSYGSSISSKTGYYLKNTRYVKMSENNKELIFFFSSKNMTFVKEVSFFGVSPSSAPGGKGGPDL